MNEQTKKIMNDLELMTNVFQNTINRLEKEDRSEIRLEDLGASLLMEIDSKINDLDNIDSISEEVDRAKKLMVLIRQTLNI